MLRPSHVKLTTVPTKWYGCVTASETKGTSAQAQVQEGLSGKCPNTPSERREPGPSHRQYLLGHVEDASAAFVTFVHAKVPTTSSSKKREKKDEVIIMMIYYYFLFIYTTCYSHDR